MTVAALVIVSVLAVCALAALVAVTVDVRAPRGRQVVVNTTRPDDQSLAGTLVHEDRRRLVLEQATYEPSGNAIPGRVHVPRERVAWVQERVS